MDVLVIEIHKVLQRRYSLGLLILTTLLFPLIVKVVSYLAVIKDGVPEGLFSNNIAFSIIAYTQTYFFLPVWIIMLIGTELSNGHVNRVIFYKSRRFYFLSKIIYCGLVTIYFSLLGILAMVISIKTAPFLSLHVGSSFYIWFFLQLMLSTFFFSVLLLCLVFFIGSPLKTFVIYFMWTFLEGILYSFFDARFSIQLKLLPIHSVRSTFTQNGELQLANYYNPLVENFSVLFVPIAFICAITIYSYLRFSKSNLPALSD